MPAALILVIDDDATQRLLIRRALEQIGFDIIEAEGGNSGIQQARERKPDLIILDVMMPDIDGFAVCRRVRADPTLAHTPILMVTGLEDQASTATAFEAGATHFLTKPINWTLISHNVRYILRNSGQEAELRQAKAEAESVSAVKSQILANVTHEFRTPLNSIIGFSDLLLDKPGQLSPSELQELGRYINEGGHQLLELLNAVLEYARCVSGEIELRQEEFELDRLLEAVCARRATQAALAGLALECSLGDLSPIVLADRLKLSQVLDNVLSNAIKFTPHGGQVSMISSQAKDGALCITVTDNGIGIANDRLARVFESFHQEQAALNRRFGGTGIGLPLAASLIQAHGGAIAIESALGNGTTVTITLPPSSIVSVDQDVA